VGGEATGVLDVCVWVPLPPGPAQVSVPSMGEVVSSRSQPPVYMFAACAQSSKGVCVFHPYGYVCASSLTPSARQGTLDG
jgi:hypothetical protein